MGCLKAGNLGYDRYMDTIDRPNARAPRVTAAMVAERAGVSTATVSLVANGKTRGRVSEDNISRVRAAISELGYVVDGIGSSLAKGVSSIVILVAPDISNPFFAKVIAGVRESLGASYQLLLSVTDAGEFPQAEDVRKLMALRPAGLLVDAPSAGFLDELSVAGPLVLLDAPGLEGYAASVNLDVAHGARELAAHLADSGHTRAAYIDSVTGTATFDVRRNACSNGVRVCRGRGSACAVRRYRHFSYISFSLTAGPQIVPLGPQQRFDLPHGREHLSGQGIARRA